MKIWEHLVFDKVTGEITEGAKKMCFLPDQTVKGLQICGEFK